MIRKCYIIYLLTVSLGLMSFWGCGGSTNTEYSGPQKEFFQRQSVKSLQGFYDHILEASSEYDMLESYLESMETQLVAEDAVFMQDMMVDTLQDNDTSLEVYVRMFQQCYAALLEDFVLDPQALSVQISNPRFMSMTFSDDYSGLNVHLRYDLKLLSFSQVLFEGTSESKISFPDFMRPMSYIISQVTPNLQYSLSNKSEPVEAIPTESVVLPEIPLKENKDMPAEFKMILPTDYCSLNHNNLNRYNKALLEADQYMYGLGKVQDVTRAFSIYRSEAEKNNTEAKVMEATFHYFGIPPVKDNFVKALNLYEEAYAAKSPTAAFWLGYIEFHRNNFGKAIKYFEYSAERGISDADFQLGMMYDTGYGVYMDKSKALVHFTKAHERGFYNATYKLYEYYAKGIFVEANKELARQYYNLYVQMRDKDMQSFNYGTSVRNSSDIYVPEYYLKMHTLFMPTFERLIALDNPRLINKGMAMDIIKEPFYNAGAVDYFLYFPTWYTYFALFAGLFLLYLMLLAFKQLNAYGCPFFLKVSMFVFIVLSAMWIAFSLWQTIILAKTFITPFFWILLALSIIAIIAVMSKNAQKYSVPFGSSFVSYLLPVLYILISLFLFAVNDVYADSAFILHSKEHLLDAYRSMFVV